MLMQTDGLLDSTAITAQDSGQSVVVAGPGSSLTIPGIIVSEIVQALARISQVTRIEVDLNTDLMAGLHRAPSLAALHEAVEGERIVCHRAPTGARLREQAFHEFVRPEVGVVVAFAWPGIDNSWIKQFIHAGLSARALTVVACASLPQPSHARAVSLAATFTNADIVLVGDEVQAKELASAYGRHGPVIESHPALSLSGRSGRRSKQQITTFLPKDDTASLATLLAAFDAIPEAWIDAYHLQVVMRFADPTVPQLVAKSYHADHVQLIGDNISSVDLQELCAASSALGIAEPSIDSQVFSMAVTCGIGTVVLGTAPLPEVGRGYVGGLMANRSSTSSVHVALIHALRLAELQFPSPDSWEGLAKRIIGASQQRRLQIPLKAGV